VGRKPERRLDVHLNLNVRGMGRSATVAINDRSNQLLREGRQVFKLGLGQSPFPVPAPVVEELRANAHEKDYLPTSGLPALRDAVADWLRRTQGVSRSGEDVLIGPGSKELMFLLQLVYYGDLVIPTPSWVSYAPQARMVGRQVRWIETAAQDGWRLTADRLAELCAEDPGRPRIVILNYPSNPTGGSYVTADLKRLAAVAREHRVVLLSDEIYGELHFKGQHVSIARFYPEGTIVSGGLSKWAGAGGWRLGTFVFPRELHWLHSALSAAASETYTATSAPIQFAAVRAYQGGVEIERYLRRSRRILKALARRSVAALGAAGLSVPAPDGAFYVFPDFSPLAERLAARGLSTSAALCEKVLEDTGVAFLPGSAFGRPPAEMTARLALVDFDGARALSALAALSEDAPVTDEWLDTHCPCTVQAVDRLAAWCAG